MQGPYDRDLMVRAKAGRRLIRDGADPHQVLASVIWYARDWAGDAKKARFITCPECLGGPRCGLCGSTGLVSIDIHRLYLTEAVS